MIDSFWTSQGPRVQSQQRGQIEGSQFDSSEQYCQNFDASTRIDITSLFSYLL